MKRQKIFAFLLSVALLLSISSGFAVGADVEKEELSTEAYAYMDLETASPEMQEKILKAREEIIFSQSWAADDVSLYVVDIETGERERVPSFSELFPGWDLPSYDPEIEEESEETIAIPYYVDPDVDAEIPEYNSEDLEKLPDPPDNVERQGEDLNADHATRRVYSGAVYLRNPSDTEASTPFFTFYKEAIEVYTYASLLTASETYNIGYRNVTTGNYLGYVLRIPYGAGCSLVGSGQYYCAVRASTYSTPGWSTLNVYNDPIVSI